VLQERYSEAARLLTNGEFENALESFSYVLHGAILALLPCLTELEPALGDDSAELEELRESSAQYVFGLRAEMEKHSVPETDGGRLCELSIIFALRPMLPEHRVLALRVAMNKCKKYGADMHTRALATQILEVCEKLQPEDAEENIKKAKKALSKKTEGMKELSFSPEDYSSVNFCTKCFTPIRSRKSAKECPACHSVACADEAGDECGICGLAMLD